VRTTRARGATGRRSSTSATTTRSCGTSRRASSSDVDRAKYWIARGAKVSETIASFLKKKGVELQRNVRLSGPKSRGKGGAAKKAAPGKGMSGRGKSSQMGQVLDGSRSRTERSPPPTIPSSRRAGVARMHAPRGRRTKTRDRLAAAFADWNEARVGDIWDVTLALDAGEARQRRGRARIPRAPCRASSSR